MFGCQQVLIKSDQDTQAVIEYLCSESAKLSNCGIYYSRQLYFKTGRIPNRAELHKVLGTENQNLHYKAFYSDTAQQILTGVAESFKSFLGLLKGINSGTVTQHPKLPGYRQSGMALVTFTGRSVKFKDGMLRFPLGSKVKAWFGLDAFFLPMPSNLDFKAIREYRILPRNGCFYLELIYKTENIQTNVDPAKCLAIDHGIDNWLTCISNAGTSFIIDGKHLKSINQGSNKRVAFLMEGKANGYWSKRLAGLTERRNRQMRDAVNKAARKVIQHCLDNQIGTVVFGWNKGQKECANMGKKTNQKFVQIPTGRLKDRIAQLCEQYGIKFVETEESYSSKASFVDHDFLPTFGEKPEGWKASGKRVKRGLYRTAQGWLINADGNGAANIARKVAIMLGLDLGGISRGDLSAPLRLKLWS
ncbi:MAG: transposase [Tychonema bourrellyi B0820]|uniref:Transposase n=1 Tax=Tychonema bourrellyi FEM_GT703 TaxID=2040638 RepID=A0A2G4F3V3_9CYAN|nr:RNA-guided endonuclease TnpB family protein [Tychonema bourrellyi]MDQ2098023.1 transposase [Tychonema bourrellyi B0820]PHX56440.1 transposase [Tychonema bourrellyi FEM_GT703]